MESRRSTLQFVVATVSLGSLGIFATQARLDARTIFLPLPVWRNCHGYLLSLFGAFPSDSEAGFPTGVLMLGNWGVLFRRHFKSRPISRDDRVPGATLHRVSSRTVFQTRKRGEIA
jgi:hypothetical protein